MPSARARYSEEKHSLPWFRRRKAKVEQEAPRSAVTEAAAPAEPEEADEPEEATAPVAEGEAPKKKRRRGSRGGRGRKKPGATAASEGSEGDAVTVQTVAARPAREKPEQPREKTEQRSQRAERAADRRRQGSQGSQRRRQPPRRAPLPVAKRELLISVDVGEQRVAVIEDDRVAEVYLERPERRSIAGNIYLGVVDNVLPGMEAAFVEIGLEKNGFLYVDEIVVPELEGKRHHGKKIQDLISRGEQLLVQAVKDPMKTKGARLTTEISLPGRFLVYVPNGEGLGVSRRLEDAERARLKEIIRSLDVKEGGVIVRTAAEGASAEDIERDLVFLQRLWKTIQARAKGARAPDLVYQEAELPLRIVRDLFAGDFVSAQVDNDRTYKRIVSYLKKTSPHMVERVHRYKEREPLFEASGVDKEIASTLDRRVDLPSGGYLVFDYAEAFTVVDVNTGRFVGSRSKSSSQRLEDTITKNNLEAVKEVVRQLRLRDIGGIIVIDFIDMANPKNRASVEDALRVELERDRTKTYVVEISPLGLVEMTRQNVTDGPREILTRKCPTCAGDGIVVSDQTVAMQIERRLRALATPGSRVQAYKVAVHPRILALVAGAGGARLSAIEEAARRSFFLVPAGGHVHTDHFDVLAEGKLADLQPAAPVAEGDTVEVKLVEVGLHDATAAAGKLDGIDVIVADAARLVGRKAPVVIGKVLEGQAFATLAAEAAAEAAGPITFESEAEKPTRAPARKKSVSVEEPASSDLSDGELVEEDEPAGADAELRSHEGGDEHGEGELETGLDGDGVERPKKRTRRGSRGGRRRREKPAGDGTEGAGDDGGAESGSGSADLDTTSALAEGPEAAPQQLASARDEAASVAPSVPARRRRAPRIHVPDDGRTPIGVADVDVLHEAVADAVAEGADEADEADDGAADRGVQALAGDVPAKKRTRRGSRGGRSRAKRTAAAGVDGIEADGEPGVAPAAKPAGVEPVVGDTVLDEAAAKDEIEDEIEAEPAAAAAPDGYVPMSQWLDDFDRR
ncbi:RNaseEG: ribonuclease, Rne/Rng family [Gaiella occulta]|uniref:RNaseEG: ribonuclease, Rne/Rng family n=1 Tax=Gaiella occulta TaxID=1002870 RepID=A0A7M2YWW5_9ACTN|nr:Rne/Rng family ribonuclease [Gaiella occulta]RDI74556.1 RNaseEG: ribonuclease, Rne/Rng family [Gaiella occulta]